MGVLGNVEETSRRGHRDEQGGAAEGDERQGQSLRRQEARHDPQVHERLRRDQDGDPERQVAAEGIGRPQSDPEPAPDQNDEEGDDGRGADEAQLLADDREDEIRGRFREVEELLAGRADALAEDPPVAEREPGLDDLKAAPAGIRPRVEERDDAAQPVRRGPDRQHERRQREREDEAQVAHPAAREEQQREREGDERQAVPEVRLSEDEHRQEASHRERRQEPAAEIGDRLALAREKRGQIEHEGELGQLRRLARYGAEPDPAPRAVDRLTERRDQHQHEEHAREDEEGEDEPFQTSVVQADRHPQAPGAEQRPEDLLLEKEVRVVEAVGRHDRARRVDHHHARREEDDRDPEEPHVGRELPGQVSQAGGKRAPLLPQTPPPLGKARQTSIEPRHEAAFSTSLEPFHELLEYVTPVFAAAELRSRHHSSRSTSFLNTSPRCSKLSNMSNEAHAGESSTTSPGVASVRARSTASWSDRQNVTGTDTAVSAAPIFSASSPMRSAWATRPRAASASGSQACPLPLPPAMSTIRSGKLSSARRVDATLVPFESL